MHPGFEVIQDVCTALMSNISSAARPMHASPACACEACRWLWKSMSLCTCTQTGDVAAPQRVLPSRAHTQRRDSWRRCRCPLRSSIFHLPSSIFHLRPLLSPSHGFTTSIPTSVFFESQRLHVSRASPLGIRFLVFVPMPLPPAHGMMHR